MRGSAPRTGQLAILVPYRNRKSYLDIFLREVPSYLERTNGISDYVIYVAEQQSQDQFNLALSRNVAARAALDDGASGYFVFHDVDVIPLCGVDYGPRNFNVEWFISDGSCKVMVAGFVKAKRYNPDLLAGARQRVAILPPGARRQRGEGVAPNARVPAGGRREPRVAGDLRRRGAVVV